MQINLNKECHLASSFSIIKKFIVSTKDKDVSVFGDDEVIKISRNRYIIYSLIKINSYIYIYCPGYSKPKLLNYDDLSALSFNISYNNWQKLFLREKNTISSYCNLMLKCNLI